MNNLPFAFRILAHGTWLRRFGGDLNVIDRPLRLDGETCTIVGVLPATRDPPIFP
jgi:hypothetical protein